MNAPARLALALVLVVSAVTGASGPLLAADRPEGKFDAVAEVKGPQGTRSMPVSIEITRAMTIEEAAPLRKVLESGGQQALLNAIRGASRGRLLLGAVEFPLDLVVAEASGDGWKYAVVTPRNFRWDEVQLEEPSLDFPFAVVLFEVPGMGRGEGTLTPRAALSIGGDGKVAVAKYEDVSGTLKDVKRR